MFDGSVTFPALSHLLGRVISSLVEELALNFPLLERHGYGIGSRLNRGALLDP